ncbi:ATP-grasp domain-containing protein [Mariniblastus sp.]|nr:ATP-grasp domain-containing protein [Mariniblastus sp.]
MSTIETLPSQSSVSQLYAADAPEAWLLAQYPSSNSTDTIFQNRTKFQIHDPFPPPPKQLLQELGPHHLMCAWGKSTVVTSQTEPDPRLLQHWANVVGDDSVPDWKPFDAQQNFITLFPHESLPAERQLVPPDINYRLHSKEIIETIDFPQAKVLDQVVPPCVVKLSHGYAGLGNFFIRNAFDDSMMREQVAQQWPDATLVINELLENIVGDTGIQFYLRKDGSVVWLGLTQQQFNEKARWSGGVFSYDEQEEGRQRYEAAVLATARCLSSHGYFGVVGIDILTDADGQQFLVDVNPRLTGVTPFLMASRRFVTQGATEGIYLASQNFAGSLAALFQATESITDASVLVLSACENVEDQTTICHLSVSSTSQADNQQILRRLIQA